MFIGQPAIDMYSNSGYIAKIDDEETGQLFTIGAGGMHKSTKQISVVFDDHISNQLSEHIVKPWIDRAEHMEPISEAEILVMLKKAEDHQAELMRERNAEAEAAQQRRTQYAEEYAGKIPKWAKAAIVAELKKNESDIMTDYHGSTTEGYIILGFSKHTRDLFPEMRKAALNAPQTRHLGPGCGKFSPRVLIDTDFRGNGCYYHKGQGSPWHHDVLPESGWFTTEAEAQSWIDNAEPLGTMNADGTDVHFKWTIDSEDIEHREKYSMGGGYYLKDSYRHNSGWKVCKYPLTRGIDSLPVASWAVPEPKAPKAKPAKAAGFVMGEFEIEEHHHTKRDCAVWLVRMVSRVEREEFQELRYQAKSLGGWYSRKWGATPAGFMFLDLDSAERFAVGDSGPPEDQKREKIRLAGRLLWKGRDKIAGEGKSNGDKLRERAERLTREIDNKRGERLENTPKRVKEAQYARLTADKLERRQQALNALADHIDAGTLPEALQGWKITNQSLDDALSIKWELVANGYHQYHAETGEYRDTSAPACALQAMIGGKTPEQIADEELQQKITALQFSKILGYFPTPPAVIEKMLEFADIQPGMRILEPSAGTGAILDAIRTQYPEAEPAAIEVNTTLCEVLDRKGYNVMQADFLMYQYFETEDKPDLYDLILMNPPFEKLQDADHVTHAYNQLAKGGRLISIMSPATFQNASKKTRQWREWFEDLGGECFELPEGSFKSSGTGVNSRLVIIDKD